VSGKARFGVSVERRVAEELSALAEALGTDRSSLVNEALSEFLHDRVHVLRPHKCEGVMVIVYERGVAGRVSSLLEEHGGLIRSRMHVHDGAGRCVETLFVAGDSREIVELERGLRGCGVVSCRYVAGPRHGGGPT